MGENDLVSIELDLDKKTIRFYLNSVDQGIAYRNVGCGDNVKYRLCVILYGSGSSVEIVGFTKA